MYYNYNKVISYNALLNILIGCRGVGKTFGASELVVKDFIKNGNEFVYLRRYKTELSKSMSKFFKALIQENKFPDDKLDVKGNTFYINDNVAGYGVTLSTAQQLKSSNFPKVKTIIFDEFLIESGQGHYLKNEVDIFLGLIETISRMRNVRVFMLANAVTEANPYFLYFDLTLPYNNDIRTFKDGLILLQYMNNPEYIEAKKKTRFGKLVSGTDYEDYAINNNFADNNSMFIEHKSGNSKFSFSFIYKDNRYGVWIDFNNSKIYVSNDFIENGFVFATTTDDHKPNTLLYSIAKNYNCWNVFIKNYKLFNFYFENNKIKNLCKDIIKNFVVRS